MKGKTENDSLILEGGWQNNRPSEMHPRYRFIENVYEELDTPQEWYFNKAERILYYYPEGNIDIKKAKIKVVRLKKSC
ncbi:hypothetical protein [uncultured Maribacter sp.]|uniref:hypothetical protein n=1 Tax=uncultured Maribacter sp. TaxID=431308 RepID=UPI0030EE506E